jgi:hypothetical protein
MGRNAHTSKKIWASDKMPEIWQIAVMCPIRNKGDKMQCSSCREMCILNVCYKVLNNILHGWPVPYAEEILGENQHGFRKGWLTSDKLFMLRCILEKFYEQNLDLHLLFVDIKQA